MEHIKKCLDLIDQIQYYCYYFHLDMDMYNISGDEVNILKDIFRKLQNSITRGEKIVFDKIKVDKLGGFEKYYSNILEQLILMGDLKFIVSNIN